MTKTNSPIVACIAIAVLALASFGASIGKSAPGTDQTPWAHSDQMPTLVTLNTVTAPAHRA